MSETTSFKLPKKIIAQKEDDPHDIIIVGVPKGGKTTICAELTKKLDGKGLLWCLEPGGTDYVSGVYVNIWNDPDDPKKLLSFQEATENYKKWRDVLLANKGEYDFLIVDSLTKLYEIAEVFGTYYYMYSVPMGKNFNRDPKSKEPYEFGHPDFRLVSTLPEGSGYQYIYKWFTSQMDLFNEIAKHRVYIAHVKDKLIKSDNVVEEVKGTEINLTGNLKRIVATRVATLCKFLSQGDKRFLSFEVDNDNIIAGSRVPRLQGKVLISEKKGDVIETYWENIFNSIKPKK